MAHERRRRQPHAWLGAGAVTLGAGAALAIGSGVAYADDASAGGTPSSRAGTSASAPHGVTRSPRGTSGRSPAGVGTAGGRAPAAARDPSVPIPAATMPTAASVVIEVRSRAARNSTLPARAAGKAPNPAAVAGSPMLSAATTAVGDLPARSAAVTAAAPPAGPEARVAAASAPAATGARAVPTLPPRLGLALYRYVLAHGLNTPSAPADPVGALMWGVFRRIETVYGLVPVAGTPTVGTPSRTTGAVTGQVGCTVPAGLPLGYTVATEPTQGSLTLGSTGYYTYTPNASAAGHTDTFAVIAKTDWAATTVTITVPITLPTTIPTPVPDTIGIAAQPGAVAFSPDGRHAYVSGSTDTFTGQGTVSVIDTVARTVIATIGNGGIPTGVAVSPDGGTVYLSAPARYDITPASLLMIDTATHAVTTIAVGKYPAGVAVSPDGSTAYVADWAHYGEGGIDADTVWVVDTATEAVVGQIGVGREPHAVVASPDGRRAYVINNGTGVPGSSTMSVIDTDADSATVNTVIATLKVGAEPIGVAVSPDGRHAYVTDLFDGSVRVIDTATNQLVAKIGLGGIVGGVAVSPDGKHVYVADAQGAVAVIDAGTNTFAGAIGVGGGPVGVAVSPDSSEVYVVKMYDQTVSVISV